MSAYVVNRETIAYLVSAAERCGAIEHSSFFYRHNGIRHEISRIGETFVYDAHRHNPYTRFTAIQTLKACDCYEYQNCEHPGWKESQAKTFIEALRRLAINLLPGYAEAYWEIPESREKEVK